MKLDIAIICCSNVVGGHELQAAALAKSLADRATVTVYLNRPEHASLFNGLDIKSLISANQFLRPGNIFFQYFDGWFRKNTIRQLVECHEQVIVSAGTVEAGIAMGVALRGYKPISLYLPSFYDRVPVWGSIGRLYNCMLSISCSLYDRIITINRIQAYIIRKFTRVSTLVISNKIREIQRPVEQGSARLVFVGRLDPQKRVHELIQWLDSKSNPIKELILFGDGPSRRQLEDQSKTLAYLKCSFFGWTSPEEQDRLIRSSDILLLNSLIEGEPLVIREARARGMFIAARDIVGTRGVTSRAERFASQIELLNRLIFISHQTCWNESPSLVDHSKKTEIKRENDINYFLRVMSGVRRD